MYREPNYDYYELAEIAQGNCCSECGGDLVLSYGMIGPGNPGYFIRCSKDRNHTGTKRKIKMPQKVGLGSVRHG